MKTPSTLREVRKLLEITLGWHGALENVFTWHGKQSYFAL